MGNKSVRIKTTPGGGDKYVKFKMEQDVDMYEILSLKISQNDLYGSFNSDFGVLVGRVIANGGIGIPNAKISVFIPISDEDKENDAISAIYPYTTPRDMNRNNVRYNLLTRVAVNNPFNTAGALTPSVPIGSFPTKEEITTNPSFIEVFEKYYKYSTVTNTSGDYMIYGVPIGNQTVHMSVDVTDIGQFSMTPATMISQLGYSPELFDGNRVKFSTDLDTIPNVDTQNISVDVRPFWGDKENFEIGITRQDFKIRATLVTSVTVFGAGFTDDYNAVWGLDSFFGNRDDSSSAMSRNRAKELEGDTLNEGVKYNTGLNSRRNGLFSIEVFTIPNRISEADILAGNFNTQTDMVSMSKTEYSEIIQDGLFLITLPCNRNKKVVNEAGQLVPTTDDDPNGIFTEFYGTFIVDYAPELSLYNDPTNKSRDQRNRSDRGRIKIPQSQGYNDPTYTSSFTSERAGTIAGKTVAQRQALNEEWRKEVYKFSGGKLYSIAKYQATCYEAGGVFYNDIGANIWRNAGNVAGLSDEDNALGFVFNNTTQYFKAGGGGDEIINNVPVFGAEWLNFCMYLPQIYNYTGGGWDVSRLLTTDFGSSTDMTVVNNYRVVGFRTDTSYFLRSDIHQSTFIEVPQSDLVTIIQQALNLKGFTSNNPVFAGNPLDVSKYKGNGSVKYFYRGLKEADIITFLIQNGIVSA